MTALHQFGAEMLKLSRGLDAVSSSIVAPMSSSSSINASNIRNSSNLNTELVVQQRPLLPPPDLPKLTRERNKWVPFYLRIPMKMQAYNRSIDEAEIIINWHIWPFELPLSPHRSNEMGRLRVSSWETRRTAELSRVFPIKMLSHTLQWHICTSYSRPHIKDQSENEVLWWKKMCQCVQLCMCVYVYCRICTLKMSSSLFANGIFCKFNRM